MGVLQLLPLPHSDTNPGAWGMQMPQTLAQRAMSNSLTLQQLRDAASKHVVGA